MFNHLYMSVQRFGCDVDVKSFDLFDVRYSVKYLYIVECCLYDIVYVMQQYVFGQFGFASVFQDHVLL